MTGCIVICCSNRSENHKEGVTFHSRLKAAKANATLGTDEISPNQIQHETEDTRGPTDAVTSILDSRTGLFRTLNEGAEISPNEIKKEAEDIVESNKAGPSRVEARRGLFCTLNEGAEISPNEIKKETDDVVDPNEAGPSRVEARTGLFCTLNEGAGISPNEIKKETDDVVDPNEAGPSRVDFSDCNIKTEENDEEPESFEITGNDSRYIEQLTPDNFLTPEDRLKHVGLIKRIYVSQSNRIRNLQGTVQRLNYLVKSLEEFIDDNEDLSPKRPRVQ